MSFSTETKQEMISADMRNCCKKACLYGMLMYSRFFDSSEISFYTKVDACAEFFSNAVREFCDVEVTTITTKAGKKHCKIESSSGRKKVLKFFGHDGGRTGRINQAILENPCCRSAFLKGAFIAVGTVSDPAKGYHLEFSLATDYLATLVIKLIGELTISLDDTDIIKAKLGSRNCYPFVYINDSTGVENILTLLDAPVASMNVMGAKVQKDKINNITRRTNLDMANIDRMVNASLKYTEAIEYIHKTGLYDTLREDVRAVADLKENSPEMSLSDIASCLGISRNAVNYRLNLILNLKKGNGEL